MEKFFSGQSLRRLMTSLLMCEAGAVITYSFNNAIAMDSVVSSAMEGLICFQINIEHSLICYAGGVAGMSTLNVTPNWENAVIGGLILFILLTILDRFSILAGMGGKLGASAFIAMIPVIVFLELTDPEYLHPYWRPEKYQELQGPLLYLILLIPATGTLACYTFRSYLPTAKHPVVAASLTALLAACIILPIPYPESSSVLVWVYTGCFVAMSAPERLSGFAEMLSTGLLAGLVAAACYGLSNGEQGGKAGFVALIAVIIMTKLLLPAFRWVRSKLCPIANLHKQLFSPFRKSCPPALLPCCSSSIADLLGTRDPLSDRRQGAKGPGEVILDEDFLRYLEEELGRDYYFVEQVRKSIRKASHVGSPVMVAPESLEEDEAESELTLETEMQVESSETQRLFATRKVDYTAVSS